MSAIFFFFWLFLMCENALAVQLLVSLMSTSYPSVMAQLNPQVKDPPSLIRLVMAWCFFALLWHQFFLHTYIHTLHMCVICMYVYVFIYTRIFYIYIYIHMCIVTYAHIRMYVCIYNTYVYIQIDISFPSSCSSSCSCLLLFLLPDDRRQSP